MKVVESGDREIGDVFASATAAAAAVFLRVLIVWLFCVTEHHNNVYKLIHVTFIYVSSINSINVLDHSIRILYYSVLHYIVF